MRLLVSGCTRTVARLMAERPDRLGVLLTPSNGNREWWAEVPGVMWACDNDCFRGLDAPAYLRMLARVAAFRTRPAWVACPDVVGDAAETLRRFDAWQPVLTELGLSAALVGQDGLTPDRVPWDRTACLFIGGTTAWKLSDEAAALVRAARGLGKTVHAGRVNSLRRIRYFARLGVDTFDGSGFSAWGEKRIPLAVRWADTALACRQRVMFGGNA